MKLPGNVSFIKSVVGADGFDIYPPEHDGVLTRQSVSICLFVLKMYTLLNKSCGNVNCQKGVISEIHRKNSVFAFIPPVATKAKILIAVSAERRVFADAGKCLEDCEKLYVWLGRMERHFDRCAVKWVLKIVKRHGEYLRQLKKLEILKHSSDKNEVDLQKMTFVVCKHIQSVSLGAWKLEFAGGDSNADKVYTSDINVMLYAGVVASAIRELLCESVSDKISVQMVHKNGKSILSIKTHISAHCDADRLRDRLLYIFSNFCDDVSIKISKHLECCAEACFEAQEKKYFQVGAQTPDKDKRLYDLSDMTPFLNRISYLNGYIDGGDG